MADAATSKSIYPPRDLIELLTALGRFDHELDEELNRAGLDVSDELLEQDSFRPLDFAARWLEHRTMIVKEIIFEVGRRLPTSMGVSKWTSSQGEEYLDLTHITSKLFWLDKSSNLTSDLLQALADSRQYAAYAKRLGIEQTPPKTRASTPTRPRKSAPESNGRVLKKQARRDIFFGFLRDEYEFDGDYASLVAALEKSTGLSISVSTARRNIQEDIRGEKYRNLRRDRSPLASQHGMEAVTYAHPGDDDHLGHLDSWTMPDD